MQSIARGEVRRSGIEFYFFFIFNISSIVLSVPYKSAFCFCLRIIVWRFSYARLIAFDSVFVKLSSDTVIPQPRLTNHSAFFTCSPREHFVSGTVTNGTFANVSSARLVDPARVRHTSLAANKSPTSVPFDERSRSLCFCLCPLSQICRTYPQVVRLLLPLRLMRLRRDFRP